MAILLATLRFLLLAKSSHWRQITSSDQTFSSSSVSGSDAGCPVALRALLLGLVVFPLLLLVLGERSRGISQLLDLGIGREDIFADRLPLAQSKDDIVDAGFASAV